MGLRRLPPGGCLLVQFWCCHGAVIQMLVPGLLPFHKCRVPYTFRLCCTDEHVLFHQPRVHCDRCTVVGLIAWTLESDELVFVMLCGSPRLRGVQRTALHAPGLLNLPKCRARACLTGLRRQSQKLHALDEARGLLRAGVQAQRRGVVAHPKGDLDGLRIDKIHPRGQGDARDSGGGGRKGA